MKEGGGWRPGLPQGFQAPHPHMAANLGRPSPRPPWNQVERAGGRRGLHLIPRVPLCGRPAGTARRPRASLWRRRVAASCQRGLPHWPGECPAWGSVLQPQTSLQVAVPWPASRATATEQSCSGVRRADWEMTHAHCLKPLALRSSSPIRAYTRSSGAGKGARELVTLRGDLVFALTVYQLTFFAHTVGSQATCTPVWRLWAPRRSDFVGV